MTDSTPRNAPDAAADETSGRRVLLVVAGAAVLVGAMVGGFVGANSAGTVVTLFGLVTVPASGPLFAGVGAALAAAGLAVLLGLVELASRKAAAVA